MNNMFFAYVLYSYKDKKLYNGYTPDNVFDRYYKHLCGMAPATEFRRPLELICFEGYINQNDALRRERYFKTTAGKRAISLMLRETLKDIRNKK